jgi:hypothetical protein
MSHLKYFNYPGWGEQMADMYSQAVRVGDRIELAGQGMYVLRYACTSPTFVRNNETMEPRSAWGRCAWD